MALDMRNILRMKGPVKASLIVTVILVIVVLAFLGSSFFIVDQTERGVVTTFGKFTYIADPGMHYKLPFGIQKSYLVKTEVVQTEQFGFRSERPGVQTVYSNQAYPQESTMLTGDLNIVEVEWIIQFRITDPKAWLFGVEDQTKTIRDVSQSVISTLVGDRSILGVIGPERASIQDNAVRMMNKTFSSFNLGIQVTQVQLQTITPPKGVQESFEDVNKAIQDMNRLINEGKEAYNSEIPKARGQADQMVEVAQGYATERVNKSKGDVARFASVLTEYRKAPEVTRTRLYFEAMEEIFKDAKNVDLIDKSLPNFLPMKNLDSQGPVPAPASGGGQ